MGYHSSFAYQKNCFAAPATSSILFGGLFSAVHIAQGAPPSPALPTTPGS